MAKPAKAKWSVDNNNTTFVMDADGNMNGTVVLLDNKQKAVTFRLVVTPDRAVRLDAIVEPGSTITGFEAWSNV